MVNRDYTQELGLPGAQKKVSKPVTAVVLIALVIGGWYVVKSVTGEHAAGAPQVEAGAKR